MRIYDNYNDYTYAQGKNEEELIQNWNQNAEKNFDWILENLGSFNDKEDKNIEVLFERCTEKQRSLAGIEYIINEVNKIEVNNIKIYK